MLDAFECPGDDVTAIDSPEPAEVWGLDDVFECARHLERDRCSAAANDGAGEAVDVLGSREQDGTRSNIGPHHMRVAELPLVDQP